jgi:phospholipase/lecithinase/hemolysin
MSLFRVFGLSLLACVVVGCSTGRSYHAFDSYWSLGYNDTRMGDDVWSVSYRGYEISQGEANDYALLRAAEVTAAAGYRYFSVFNEQNSTSTTAVGSFNAYQGTGSGFMSSTSYPEVRLSIKAYKTKPAGGAMLDNQYLAPAIRQKYGLGK